MNREDPRTNLKIARKKWAVKLAVIAAIFITYWVIRGQNQDTNSQENYQCLNNPFLRLNIKQINLDSKYAFACAQLRRKAVEEIEKRGSKETKWF